MENLIDEESKKHLQERFKNEFKNEVTVDIFVNKENTSEFCEFTIQLLKELNEIEPRIKYQVLDANSDEAKKRDVFGTPSIFVGYDKGYKISYRGAPLGYEAASLIESIVMVSKEDSGLNPKSREMLSQIKKPVKIDVYVTPTCPYCPQAVLLAQRIALETKGLVEGNMIEAQENMERALKFNVSSVPQQVINDLPDSVTVGVQPEVKLVQQVASYGS